MRVEHKSQSGREHGQPAERPPGDGQADITLYADSPDHEMSVGIASQQLTTQHKSYSTVEDFKNRAVFVITLLGSVEIRASRLCKPSKSLYTVLFRP